MRKSLFILGFILLSAKSAFAASEPVARLEVLQGKALVNTGEGFQAVDGDIYLHAGDKIHLKTESAAVLSSAETGCVIALRSAGTFTVPVLSECNVGQAFVMTSEVVITPVNGYVVPPAPPVAGIAPLLVGGVVVVSAASIIALSALTDDTLVTPVSVP